MYIAKPPTKRIIPTVKSRCHILTVEAGLIILKYLTVLWTQIPSDYYANSGITMPPVPTRHRPLPASLQHTLHQALVTELLSDCCLSVCYVTLHFPLVKESVIESLVLRNTQKRNYMFLSPGSGISLFQELKILNSEAKLSLYRVKLDLHSSLEPL